MAVSLDLKLKLIVVDVFEVKLLFQLHDFSLIRRNRPLNLPPLNIQVHCLVRFATRAPH